MINRTIDDTNFLISFRNKDGEEVTINPNEGFDMILKYNFCSRVLHNCYMTMTETNELGFPYEVRDIKGNCVRSIPELSVPQYSFDVSPQYCEDVAIVPEPVKEKDNVEVPVIDETEKLHNNLIHKLTDKK